MLRSIAILFVLLCTVTARADEGRIDQLFSQLAAASDAGQAQAVEVQLRRIWSDTGDPDLNKLMTAGQDAMARQDAAAALASFDALLARRPDHAEAHLRRAQVLIMLGEIDRAQADAATALEREPRHFRALQVLGFIHAARGEQGAAIDAYERALALNPNLLTVRAQIERLRGSASPNHI
jgi:tetratricopeptide (TPR) repeat protein